MFRAWLNKKASDPTIPFEKFNIAIFFYKKWTATNNFIKTNRTDKNHFVKIFRPFGKYAIFLQQEIPLKYSTYIRVKLAVDALLNISSRVNVRHCDNGKII